MLADALLASRNFWDHPLVVTSILIQGYDNRGLVLLCVYVFSILWICIDFLKYYMVYYAAPKNSRFNSIKNGLYQDWRRHLVPSGNVTNQLQVSWGAKFKFLLNVNLNNFII
jgi:hypothetical protein